MPRGTREDFGGSVYLRLERTTPGPGNGWTSVKVASATLREPDSGFYVEVEIPRRLQARMRLVPDDVLSVLQ